MPIVTSKGQRIRLADVATISIQDGPPGIKSENARLNGWVFVDIENIDVGSYVERAKKAVEKAIDFPPGYSVRWAGQYEYMMRAKEKLSYVVPLTLIIVVILLFLNFRNFADVSLIILTIPFSLIGGIWLIWMDNVHYSSGVGVGFIALAGVATETGILMVQYLKQSLVDAQNEKDNGSLSKNCLLEIVLSGAMNRIRPVLMTAIATIVGLLPAMSLEGTGSEVMSRIATPMVGGMISSVILTLFVIPVVFYVWYRYRLDDN
jgi:Cu(I)/Ag(I) efflux system membrane protein CusA/SilA